MPHSLTKFSENQLDMATATKAQAPSMSAWSGGKLPLKARYGKLMMWFFLMSDAFTFSAFLVSYGVARFMYPSYEGDPANFTFNPDAYWPIPEKVFSAAPFIPVEAPLVFVGIMTFILILSSVTMVLAVEAGHRASEYIQRGELEKARLVNMEVEKWMLWTILGGAVFLGCQAWEWSHFIHGAHHGSAVAEVTEFFGANLIQNQYGPPLFADFFFFITGFHGTHVLSGVILNIIIFYNVVIGTYLKRGHYEMVEKVGLYWHFVDLVWVFVFTFFYLV